VPEPADNAVRRRMQRQPRRDTKPELELRRELHRRGLRYRVDVAPLAGMRSRADVVFPSIKVAVFVDGCFWHGCPEHGTAPATNAAWWRDKLSANRARDRRVDAELECAGWKVVRVWEHESATAAADRVESAVRTALPQRRARE
jgi:DNA mismatch endonuclease (patch repair protein)